MSDRPNSLSVFRSTKIDLSCSFQSQTSTEFQSFQQSGQSGELLIRELRGANSSRWKFVMLFINQTDGYRYASFRLYCIQLPHDKRLQSGAKGSIQVKFRNVNNYNISDVVAEGSCETVIQPGNLVCETFQIPLDKIKVNIELSADLDVIGLEIPPLPVAPTFSVRTPPQRSSLAPFLAKLAADSLFTDVTIEAGGEPSCAHRAVLAARSPVLCAMLSTDMQEGREARIVLQDVSSAAWRAFQTFLYTDAFKAPKGDTGLLLEVLMLSDKYEVEPLKECVEEALVGHMTVDNVVEIFEAAQTFRVPRIKDTAANVIVRNWKVLKKETKVMTWMTSGSDLGAALFERLHF